MGSTSSTSSMSAPTPTQPAAWPDARAAARDLGDAIARDHRTGSLSHQLALPAARGATLATELVAPVNLPGNDSAAMDGYALRGPGPWTVVERVLAGRNPQISTLAVGEAVEVATGAPVPAHTDCVLPYERARRTHDQLTGQPEPGRHVRRRGEDVRAGSVVLSAGTAITPAVVGLAASLGYDELPVRRPGVCLLMTGDEVRDAGTPGVGEVRDAIGPVLPGVAHWAGGGVLWRQHLRDDPALLGAAITSARTETEAPVIVVAGASSAGPADHLRAVLGDLGAQMVVDGVACRPGHPQLLAVLRAGQAPPALVVGLPGNPYAALAAAVTLLVPAVSACAGRSDPGRAPQLRLPLRQQVQPHERDTRLVAVRIEDGVATALGRDRPASLWGAAQADALAVLPPAWTGSDVELLWLPH